MKKSSKLILVSLLLISVLVYQFWFPLKQTYSIKVFYPGTALLFLGFTFVIWRETPKGTGFKYFTELFFLLSFNNLIDESFFNPTKIELNEYLVAGTLLIRFTYILWTLARNKQLKPLPKK